MFVNVRTATSESLISIDSVNSNSSSAGSTPCAWMMSAMLEKPDPDLEVARRGFIQGRNHPDDVGGMIRLFRRFGDVSFMAKAIDIWAVADEYIVELAGVADQLRGRIESHRNDRSMQDADRSSTGMIAFGVFPTTPFSADKLR